MPVHRRTDCSPCTRRRLHRHMRGLRRRSPRRSSTRCTCHACTRGRRRSRRRPPSLRRQRRWCTPRAPQVCRCFPGTCCRQHNRRRARTCTAPTYGSACTLPRGHIDYSTSRLGTVHSRIPGLGCTDCLPCSSRSCRRRMGCRSSRLGKRRRTPAPALSDNSLPHGSPSSTTCIARRPHSRRWGRRSGPRGSPSSDWSTDHRCT
jgi:hypothetical protein